MNRRAAHVALIAIGVVALLMGATFVGQSLNLIPGSFMTGNQVWFPIGLVIAIAGLVMIILGFRRRGRDSSGA